MRNSYDYYIIKRNKKTMTYGINILIRIKMTFDNAKPEGSIKESGNNGITSQFFCLELILKRKDGCIASIWYYLIG
jgi:hypothetical protein